MATTREERAQEVIAAFDNKWRGNTLTVACPCQWGLHAGMTNLVQQPPRNAWRAL